MALQTSQRPPAMFNPWSSSSQDPTNNDDTTSAPRGPLPAMYPPRPIGRLHNAAAVNGNSHAAGHIGPASSQTRSTSSLLSQALHPQQQLQHQQQSQNHRFRDRPAKDTSHVPCKFFRTGECQAGRACPFSHNLDTPEQPCRYFAKVRDHCHWPHLRASKTDLQTAGDMQVWRPMCSGSRHP